MEGGRTWKDVLLRALILLSGAIAAVLFILKGEGQALPALALGSTLGVFLVGFSYRQEG